MKRSRDLAEARKTAQKFAKYASMAARERDGTSVLSLATYHVSGLAVVACDSKSRSRSPSIEDECAIPASRCGQLPPPLESVDVVPDVDCANFVEVVIARDPAAAVDMYVDAYTNCGVPASQSLTAAAEILLNEEGVERDVEKAMELYLAAARSEPIINSATALPSSGVSLVAIADAFRDGLGTKSGQPDFVKAWELYKEAAELGDSTALVRLGDSLRDGLGCEKNPTVAFGYYTKAAEVRDKEGIRRLAQCYWTGEGCEVDVVRAKKLAVEIGENHAF
ncbi:hypothetical protein DFJ73DRAFT_798085 [Zopfochytrium polystomum]|nr:hypothetical protein DFJ73DRAFT_798085 [Zopfochytrium polystomum]